MKEGPADSATATADQAGAPSPTFEHTRVDVSLADFEGAKGGYIRLEADEAGDALVALSADVPLAIVDAAGADVGIESTERGSEHCDEVKVVHTVELEVGEYLLKLGPTDATTVGLVVEHAGGHDEPH